MKVIIDERETALYEKCESILCSQSKASYIQLSKEVLNLGDILIKTDENKDVLLIERKSFNDLLASIKDGRYEEQSYRLLHSSGFPPHSVFYLIEGMLSQLRAPIEKKIIFSAISTLQFFKGFSVHRTSSVHESAEWLLQFADKIERNFLKGVVPYYLTTPFHRGFINNNDENTNNMNDPDVAIENIHQPKSADYCHVVKKVKKDNVTPENIGEIILCQIPGISSVTAITIMKRFSNFTHFMEELIKDSTCLENLTIESNGKIRKMSKSVVENIRKYLLNQS